jgi:hypothetical protein
MKSIFCLTTFFALCLTAATAQTQTPYVGTLSPDSTSTCTYNFTSGSGNAFIKYCVTKNGNILQFQSPKGQTYMPSTSPMGEGYGFCNFDSQTGYYDYADYGDSGNWEPSAKVSSSKDSVVISRKTADGNFTFVQTITLVPPDILAQVQMKITNNSDSSAHIGLLRYAYIDIDNVNEESFDNTLRTAFGLLNNSYGLTLRYAAGGVLNGGFVQNVPYGPDPCQPFFNVVGPLTAQEGSLMMQYDIKMAGKSSSTVIVQYRSF